jgi:hypothetical protein
MEMIALLELEMVIRAYQQDEQRAIGCFKKLYDNSVALLFMSSEPRSEVQQWLESKSLDNHNYAYKEDAIKWPYHIFKSVLPDWKQSFVRSYLEETDKGNIEPKMDKVYVVFGDEKVRQGVEALNDRRVSVYQSLEDLVNEINTPHVKLFTSSKDLLEELNRLKNDSSK